MFLKVLPISRRKLNENQIIMKNNPLFLLLIVLKLFALNLAIYGSEKNIQVKKNNIFLENKNSITWEFDEEIIEKKIRWEVFQGSVSSDEEFKYSIQKKDVKGRTINSLNRSIVFDNNIVGPDIGWNVPPGFSWNKKYKFDLSVRGHNTSIPNPPNINFFGWNSGDAVGLVSYQFLEFEKSTFGVNFGIRSIYEGDELGGTTSFGEGMSGGFRYDYKLSNNSGIAFGAEQLIHFDELTDTGRNIYLTASKAWWTNDSLGRETFPLNIATAGIGSGRMAIGNIKGLCSDLFGGDGTEIGLNRRLCWSPIFSLARVWNEKFSTFFEYNSRFFLLGSSVAPVKNIPIRGTFALIISDHRDNYKIHDTSELTWTFNLSLGF